MAGIGAIAPPKRQRQAAAQFAMRTADEIRAFWKGRKTRNTGLSRPVALLLTGQRGSETALTRRRDV
jgi:hypothetical protein